MKENYYDKISESYEELHKEEQLKKIMLLSKYINPKQGDKLLDVGCGTGISTEPWNCIRFGLDSSEKLLEIGKKLRKGISFIKGEAENMPFPDRYFDYVISITSVQNFKDIEKGLKEIKRVGKGRFIISFLKKSGSNNKIKEMIEKIFEIREIIEEDKDLIFIA